MPAIFHTINSFRISGKLQAWLATVAIQHIFCKADICIPFYQRKIPFLSQFADSGIKSRTRIMPMSTQNYYCRFAISCSIIFWSRYVFQIFAIIFIFTDNIIISYAIRSSICKCIIIIIIFQPILFSNILIVNVHNHQCFYVIQLRRSIKRTILHGLSSLHNSLTRNSSVYRSKLQHLATNLKPSILRNGKWRTGK